MQTLRVLSRVLHLGAAASLWLALSPARAQAPFAVYADQLVNGFQDWGWAPHNYANALPVHSGTSSVAVTMTSGYQGLHQSLAAPPLSQRLMLL